MKEIITLNDKRTTKKDIQQSKDFYNQHLHRPQLLGPSKIIVKNGRHQIVHTNTDFKTLKIYKENGKVIISKKSGQMGVVYLDTIGEVEKTAKKLNEIVADFYKK